jgi:hypothetical protein
MVPRSQVHLQRNVLRAWGRAAVAAAKEAAAGRLMAAVAGAQADAERLRAQQVAALKCVAWRAAVWCGEGARGVGSGTGVDRRAPRTSWQARLIPTRFTCVAGPATCKRAPSLASL